LQLALLVAGGLEVLLGVAFDPVQIIVIKGQAAQRRIRGGGQLLERGAVECAQLRAAGTVGARLAAGVANDPVIAAAHRQYQHLQGTAR